MQRWLRRRKLQRQMDSRIRTRVVRRERSARASRAPLPTKRRRRWRLARFVWHGSRKLVVGVAFLLVASVVFVVGAVMLVDVKGAEKEIAAALEAATGRKVEIDGTASLKAGVAPTLILDGMRIGNPPWAKRRHLLSARRVEAQIAIIPLLSGKVELRRLVLVRPKIDLEVDEAGRRNWAFKERGGSVSVDTVLSGIGAVRIRSGRARYVNRKTGERTTIDLARLSVTRGRTGRLGYRLEGSFNGRRLEARGNLGPPGPSGRRGRAWPVEITGRAGGSAINADGSIVFAGSRGRADLVFAVVGRDLSELGAWFDADFPRIGPYNVAGRLTAQGPDWQLRDARIKVGRTSFSGSGTVAPLADPVRIRTTLTSTVIDVDTVLDDLAGRRQRGRSWTEDRVTLGGLGGVDARVRLSAGRLQIGSLRVERLVTDIRLADGNLRFLPLKAQMGRGRVTGSIRLDPAANTLKVAANFQGRDVPMSRLSHSLLGGPMVQGAADLDASLRAKGATLGQMVSSLAGSVGLVMGRGRLQSNQLQVLSAGVISAISPWAPSNRDTGVNCIVSRFDIDRGVARSKATVIDTPRATVVGDGAIDLTRQHLAMTITPRAKDVSLMSLMVPIRVAGALSDPSAFPDPRRLASGTIGVITGLAGTVFSAIGFGDSARDGRKTCAEAISQVGRPASG